MTALDRLLALANHLEPDQGYELRRLLVADGPALRYIDAEQRADRAEALAQECRRQLAALDRQCTLLRENLENAHQALGALAQVHGGSLRISEHLLMRGPFDVRLLVDPVNHEHRVVATKRR